MHVDYIHIWVYVTSCVCVLSCTVCLIIFCFSRVVCVSVGVSMCVCVMSKGGRRFMIWKGVWHTTCNCCCCCCCDAHRTRYKCCCCRTRVSVALTVGQLCQTNDYFATPHSLTSLFSLIPHTCGTPKTKRVREWKGKNKEREREMTARLKQEIECGEYM